VALVRVVAAVHDRVALVPACGVPPSPCAALALAASSLRRGDTHLGRAGAGGPPGPPPEPAPVEEVELPYVGGGSDAADWLTAACGCGGLRQQPPIGQPLSPDPQTYSCGQQTSADSHKSAFGPQSAASTRPPHAAVISATAEHTIPTHMPALACIRKPMHGSVHGSLKQRLHRHCGRRIRPRSVRPCLT
jgi:hypothetical protein